MERIIYRKTLDVHKSGVQFTLQGFETADNMSRRVEISLMASGDAIDFPLEQIMAVMYIKAPGVDETSVVECEIKDNTVVYDVLPVTKEGIAELQLKLIDIRPEGAKAVLAAPKFAMEVIKSNTDEEAATQTATFTALEEAVSKAKAVYDARFLRMEIDSDGVFRAYYADGTVFENDSINRLLFKGDAVLAKSYAKGGTGVRTDEEIDNAKYYSNVSKSAITEVQNGLKDANAVLEEVKLHGVYTVFSVDFETGEIVYISPKYKFGVNNENGDLEVEGQAYTIDKEIRAFVDEYLLDKSFDIEDIVKKLNDRKEEIDKCNQEIEELQKEISESAKQVDLDNLNARNLQTRFGGIEYISTEDIPLEDKNYTPPDGMSLIATLTFDEGKTVYIVSESYQAALGSDDNCYHYINLYCCNFDNTEMKHAWKFNHEEDGRYDKINYYIDNVNNHICIRLEAANSNWEDKIAVYEISNDNKFYKVYENTGLKVAYFGSIYLYNNAIYAFKGTSGSDIPFIKLDYTDTVNPVMTSFSRTFEYSEISASYMAAKGEDLYLCCKEKVYKFVGGVTNCAAEVKEFPIPKSSLNKGFYKHQNCQAYFTKSNGNSLSSATLWASAPYFCWFINDKFYILSECMFHKNNLWASTSNYLLREASLDGDYMLVLESCQGLFLNQFIVLYLINYKTGECLWRYPFTDLFSNNSIVLDSENFEFSVCRTDGKMDTYKIIFSDEVGW